MKASILWLSALLCSTVLFGAAQKSAPPPANFRVHQEPPNNYARGWLWPALPSGIKMLEITVKGWKHNVKTEITAEVMERAMFHTPVTLYWGTARNKFRVQVKDFKPRVPYDVEWDFTHVLKFSVPPELGEVVAVHPVEFWPKGRPWYDLADPKPPKKVIKGETWTEGLSFTGLGRYPNSQRAENLTETVFDDSFQVLLSLWDRGNFLFRPIVPADTKFKKTTQIDFLKRVVTSEGSHGEKVTVTASNAGPGFLIDSLVPLEILYTGLQKGKVIEGFVGEDMSEFLKNGVKHNLDPQKRAQFRCEGILLPGESKLTDPAQLKTVDFQKLKEPWIVMLWRLPDKIANVSVFPRLGWHIAILVTHDGTAEFGDGSVKLSKGITGISSSFNRTLPKELNITKLGWRAAMLSKALRNYPVSCHEYYCVTDDKVKIRDEYGYIKWGDKKFQDRDYAPVPPMLAMTSAYTTHLKLPLTARQLDQGLATMHGPWCRVWSNVLEYEFKRIPFDHSLMPGTPDAEEETKQAAFILDRTPFPATGRPFKPYREAFGQAPDGRGFFPMCGLLAWGSFNDATRQHILDILKTGIERATVHHLWLSRKENFTRHPYLINGWPADPTDSNKGRYYQGDGNTMNSSVWLAVYMYAKYSGDWAYAKKMMPLMKSLYLYDELVNAWDNPGPSGRDHIHLTEIDMDTISALGLGSLEKMAHTLGDKELEARFAYVRMKSFNCNIAKVVFPNWLYQYDKWYAERTICRGFFANTCNISLYKSFPADWKELTTQQTWNNWFTTQPELPLEFVRAVKPEILRDHQYKKFESIFPLWQSCVPVDNGHPWDYVDYVFNTLEQMIAFGDGALAEERYDAWLKMIAARKKPLHYSYWKGCTLYDATYIGTISRVRSAKYGFELRDWEPATVGEYRLDPATMTVKLSLKSPKPFLLRFHSRKVPQLSGVNSLGDGEYFINLNAGTHNLVIPLK